MTGQRSTSETLSSPQRTDLPYFAYGLFKPGELAHQHIEPLLDGDPVPARIPGALYVRDGLPLLELGGRGFVLGYLMFFREDCAYEAYARISAFEPKKHYKWDEVRLEGVGKLANALIGRRPECASIRHEEGVWTGRRDPVLTAGLKAVGEVADKHAREEFVSAPPDVFDWPRLFKLQMAYLFLWTVIERYTALSYGPTLDPMKKVIHLGEDPAFARAVKQTVTRVDKVYDSRNPKNREKLDPDEAISSAKYYYAVRSNLSHRGKGAWKDGEIIRRSLGELQAIMSLVLRERMGIQS